MILYRRDGASSFMYARLRFLFVLGVPFVGAQNYTTCNPTTQSNCPPIPAFGSAQTIYNFNESYPITDIFDFDLFSQNTITQDSDGVHITVTAIGEEPYVETTRTILLYLQSNNLCRLFILWQGYSDNDIDKCECSRHIFKYSIG